MYKIAEPIQAVLGKAYFLNDLRQEPFRTKSRSSNLNKIPSDEFNITRKNPFLKFYK